MRRIYKVGIILLGLLLVLSGLAFAQNRKSSSARQGKFGLQPSDTIDKKRKVAFGFEVKPIIPSAMFRVTTDVVRVNDLVFTISPRPGFTYGAHLTFSLTPRFSLETGINYISRDFRIEVADAGKISTLQFTADNYEVPLITTYYVRLSDKIYMGHSAGLSMQFLPSHLASRVEQKDATGTTIYSLEQISRRMYWMWPAFKGGIGWEYRTDNSGYFYVGPAYLLFTSLYKTRLFYNRQQVNAQNIDIKPIGDFFGITFRYVFPPTEMFKKREKTGKR